VTAALARPSADPVAAVAPEPTEAASAPGAPADSASPGLGRSEEIERLIEQRR
jgi:hypothetical protein